MIASVFLFLFYFKKTVWVSGLPLSAKDQSISMIIIPCPYDGEGDRVAAEVEVDPVV